VTSMIACSEENCMQNIALGEFCTDGSTPWVAVW